jgi:hypothetical protein
VRFLGRFQRIERARRSGVEESVHPAERFETLESMAPLPEMHTAASPRFSPAAEAEPALTLQPHDEQQPFVRCTACGRDHGREAQRCLCGAALDTAEVRAFNATLWASVQAERAAERASQATALAAEADDRAREARQLLGEQLAREVAEQARGPKTTLLWVLAVVGLVFWILLLSGHGRLALGIGLVALGILASRSVGDWLRQREPVSRRHPGQRPPG